MYNKCNQWLGGWRVLLPGILGGFETRQKQIFHIFGTREKIRNFFFQEISVFIGKIGDFSPIFLLPIFPPENLFQHRRKPIFRRKIGRKNRFFCPWLIDAVLMGLTLYFHFITYSRRVNLSVGNQTRSFWHRC